MFFKPITRMGLLQIVYQFNFIFPNQLRSGSKRNGWHLCKRSAPFADLSAASESFGDFKPGSTHLKLITRS